MNRYPDVCLQSLCSFGGLGPSKTKLKKLKQRIFVSFQTIPCSYDYANTVCHPPHTVIIVTNNTENRLKELKEHLLDRKHLQHIKDYSFTKYFIKKIKLKKNNNIPFIRIYNPNHIINFTIFHSCIDRIIKKELKTCFQKKKVSLFTKQP